MNKKLGTPIGKMVIGIRRSISNHHDCCNQNQNQNEQSLLYNSFNLNDINDICNPKYYKQQQQQKLYETNLIKIIRADHILTNTNLVIKMIDLENDNRNDQQQQSSSIDVHINEINMLVKLRHTNVIQLLTSFINDNYLWQIMPYAEYGSADQWSKPNGLSSELIIALIIKDVLCGLNYLHCKGIIHRAICGEHILIMSNGNCVLTGLKYSTNVIQMGRWKTKIHQYPKQTTTKLLNFLAPEILEQNLLGYNFKSDIYSIGIVCCELANGCIPFEDIVLTEMLLDKLTGNFPRPLDSTCDEIRNFPTDNPDLSIEVQEKYNFYKNRTFSTNFHTFTIEHCLNFDSNSRSTASDLLNHQFIKQISKKCHQQNHHHLNHKEKNSSSSSSSLLIELLKNYSSRNINNGNYDNDNDEQQCSMMTTKTETDNKIDDEEILDNQQQQQQEQCQKCDIDWIF